MPFFPLLQLTGTPGLPTYIGDCSSSGKATLSGADINLKQITKNTKLKAKIELQVCYCFHFFCQTVNKKCDFCKALWWSRQKSSSILLVSRWHRVTAILCHSLWWTATPSNSSVPAPHSFSFNHSMPSCSSTSILLLPTGSQNRDRPL